MGLTGHSPSPLSRGAEVRWPFAVLVSEVRSGVQRLRLAYRKTDRMALPGPLSSTLAC